MRKGRGTMAGRKSDEITAKFTGTDECGAFTNYRYADGSEFTVRNLIKSAETADSNDGKSYMEQLAPHMVPFDEYLTKNNLTKREWWRIHEEGVQGRIHNCIIRTTISE